jgi:hypothetical protein
MEFSSDSRLFLKTFTHKDGGSVNRCNALCKVGRTVGLRTVGL